MVEIDFLEDKRPVMIYDMDKTDLESVAQIFENLKIVYPNIIALPKNFHIEWWTKEQIAEIKNIIEGW